MITVVLSLSRVTCELLVERAFPTQPPARTYAGERTCAWQQVTWRLTVYNWWTYRAKPLGIDLHTVSNCLNDESQVLTTPQPLTVQITQATPIVCSLHCARIGLNFIAALNKLTCDYSASIQSRGCQIANILLSKRVVIGISWTLPR